MPFSNIVTIAEIVGCPGSVVRHGDVLCFHAEGGSSWTVPEHPRASGPGLEREQIPRIGRLDPQTNKKASHETMEVVSGAVRNCVPAAGLPRRPTGRSGATTTVATWSRPSRPPRSTSKPASPKRIGTRSTRRRRRTSNGPPSSGPTPTATRSSPAARYSSAPTTSPRRIPPKTATPASSSASTKPPASRCGNTSSPSSPRVP